MSSKLKKKSFLDRVLSRERGESPGKLDKRERHRYRDKVSSNPSSNPSLDTEEKPAYDDVSDLTLNQEPIADEGEQLPEYMCPPPPRPIYEVKLSTESQNSNETQEFYDDVGAYQEQRNKSQVKR